MPVRTRVGHSFIKQVMAETGAIFGGEHSAHYYFRDNWRADSGSIAALCVLEQLSPRRRAALGAAQAVRALRAERRDQLARRRPAGGDRAGRGGVHASCEQDRLDGLTVDCGDWWFNLRPSNTEPLLRLNLEAPDRRHPATPHTAEVLALIRVGGVARSMALDSKLLEILACPEDKGPLLYFADEDTLYNPRLEAALPRARRTTSRPADRRRRDRRRRRSTRG